jgi:hypothetical protein
LDCASCLSQQLRGITLVDSQFCTLYDASKISTASFLSDVNNDISNSKNDDKYYSLGKSILGEHLQAFSVCSRTMEINAHVSGFILRVNNVSKQRNKAGHDKSDVGTRLLWSDDLVNVWEFRLESNESCPFHVHKLPYMFFNLKVSLTQALSESAQPDKSKPRMQLENQITVVRKHELSGHGVRNVGNGFFQQYIVEFK